VSSVTASGSAIEVQAPSLPVVLEPGESLELVVSGGAVAGRVSLTGRATEIDLQRGDEPWGALPRDLQIAVEPAVPPRSNEPLRLRATGRYVSQVVGEDGILDVIALADDELACDLAQPAAVLETFAWDVGADWTSLELPWQIPQISDPRLYGDVHRRYVSCRLFDEESKLRAEQWAWDQSWAYERVLRWRDPGSR